MEATPLKKNNYKGYDQYSNWAVNHQSQLDDIRKNGKENASSAWLTNPWTSLKNAVGAEVLDWSQPETVLQNGQMGGVDASGIPDQRDILLDKMKDIEEKRFNNQSLSPEDRAVQKRWEELKGGRVNAPIWLKDPRNP